jgi:hypothetical protein
VIDALVELCVLLSQVADQFVPVGRPFSGNVASRD